MVVKVKVSIAAWSKK